MQLVLYMLPLRSDLSQHAPFIAKLQKWTAVVPLIAKADLYSGLNVTNAKNGFLHRSEEAGIDWYDIRRPLKDLLPALAIEATDGKLGGCPPFWTITANKSYLEANRQVLYRQSSRGTYYVDDPAVSDFRLLYTVCAGGLHPALVRNLQKLHKIREEALIRQAEQRDMFKKILFVAGVAGTVGTLFYFIKENLKKN